MANNLETKLTKAVYGYLEAFEKKHEVEFTNFINDDILDVVVFGDYYLGLQDIVFDINSKQPEGQFFEWYEATLEHGTVGISYKSWCKGLRYEDIRPKEDFKITKPKEFVVRVTHDGIEVSYGGIK